LKRLFLISMFVLLLVGCISTETTPPLATGGEKLSKDFAEKIGKHIDELEKEYLFRTNMLLVSDEVELQIVNYDDFTSEISKDKLTQIKKSLFVKVGKEFPIKISQCCMDEEPDIKGEITKIDKEKRTVLIVSHSVKNGDTEYPEATWGSVFSDTKITINDESMQSFDDLMVGQKVKAWFIGHILHSYPTQTSLIKVEIMK
jgi:hypothetical protein